ncbi:MAG: hypothetical protein AAGI72_24205 [Pseudomonadota bacterium]
MATTIDRFSESVGLIYEASLEPQLWPVVLKALCDELDASKGHIMYFSKYDQKFSFTSGYGFNPYSLNLGVDQMKRCVAEDPVYLYGTKHSNEVFSDRRAIDPRTLQTSEMQTRLRGPMGIDQLLTVVIDDGLDEFSVLGVYREATQPHFDGDDELWLARYVPHIKRATTIHKEFISAARFDAIEETVLDSLRTPLLIVDEHLNTAYCNSEARAVMADSGSLSIEDSRLRCATEVDDERLRSVIASAFAEGDVDTRRNAVKIGGEHGRSRLVLVVNRLQVQKLDEMRQYLPVTEEHFTATIPTRRTVLVTLCDPAAYRLGAVEVLQDTFGLTPAESELVDCLADDLSLKEASELLGRSVGTARVQLNSVFAKTDTHRQSTLIKLVMSIPG